MRVAGNPDSLDAGDDPDAIRLCALKNCPALYASGLLPLGSVFLGELTRHCSGIAVSGYFHALRLDLHTNGTGAFKRVFVTSVQFSHGRPNLLQGGGISLLK